MDLLDNLHKAVLTQREEEVTNFFTNVDDLREFITAREPAAGVNITVKMCCFSADRLSADNGTRVTLVNANARALFDSIQSDLVELNAINRKPFIVQITVWDGKKKTGSPRAGRMQFRVGALYEFRQVHNVGFYSDIPKGSVQLDGAVNDRVVEKAPPILKRKASDTDSPERRPKARALEFVDEEEKEGGKGGDVAMPSLPRTRGKQPSK